MNSITNSSQSHPHRVVDTRRGFLKTLTWSAAGLAFSNAVMRAGLASAAAALTSEQLGSGLQLIAGAGGNVLQLTTADGVLLVDGGDARHSEQLLQVVANGDAHRVRALINTHWHPEQTGSNEALGRLGTRIIAHENTKLWLGTDIDLKWQNKMYPPRPREALPTETIYTTATLEFGGKLLEYGHLPQAHTDGDLYVFLPEQNVLIAGDCMAVGSYPILDWCTGGWIGGMANASRRLLDMTDANTRIVPGSGPIQTRADLQVQHDMLTEMRGRLVTLLKKGMSIDEMLAARPTQEFDARWGDPTLFIANAYPGLVGHVRELGGIL